MKKMGALGGKASVAKLGKPIVSMKVNAKSPAAVPAIKAAAKSAISAIKSSKLSGVATMHSSSGKPTIAKGKLGKI